MPRLSAVCGGSSRERMRKRRTVEQTKLTASTRACMGSGLQVVTSELRLRYREPVPTGSEVTVIGEVTGERRRLVDVKGWVELDGRLMAEAEVVMFRTGD